MSHPITPCLWFDGQAEEAARFYVSIFKNSKIGPVSRFGKDAEDNHFGIMQDVLRAVRQIKAEDAPL